MEGAAEHPVGTEVVVQSRRGLEVGTVRSGPRKAGEHAAGRILRAATPRDLSEWSALKERARSVKWLLRARARKQRLEVKIVAVEFTLEESLVTVSYSANSRIELSQLTSAIREQTPARVNFVSVGPREQAQLLGTLGACGRESCSSTHLQEFAPVTIRMARDQQLPLNPEKLSGPCGRLLCCLQYEHPVYQQLLSRMPKRGSLVLDERTGTVGKVSKLNPLSGQVSLLTEAGKLVDCSVESLKRV
jgi:cell fate regulator YaaT (PSP1 superfamily)